MSTRGLIVASPGTGAGKTILMLGLLRALHERSLRVGALKIGPDFIDPAFHRAAGASASFNLDHWGMRPELRAALIASAGSGCDLVLAEGMMGLFDGALSGGGSTADVAAETGWPVILAIDAGTQAQSAAALASGFVRFRPDVEVAGVVLMRVGGTPHRRLLKGALDAAGIRMFGMVGHDAGLDLPERHLGLVQAREQALEPLLARVGAAVSEGVDLEAILACARRSQLNASAPRPPGIPPLGQRIALADDDAFAFAYPHLVRAWRNAGAEITAFAPLAGEGPPADCDAVFLPGGYPELHAGRLAASQGFRDGVRAAAARGAAVYGECGGYMALGEALVDGEGRAHAMLGLLPLVTSFAAPQLHIGYRTVTLAADAPLGRAGTRFRAHEFHFARVVSEDTSALLFQAADDSGVGLGPAGARRGSVLGSYLHLIDVA